MDFEYLRHVAREPDRGPILDELLLAYGKDVWNYAFFLTRRRDLAEDIAQDVFVKVYQRMDTFRGASGVKSWLLTITRHTRSTT